MADLGQRSPNAGRSPRAQQWDAERIARALVPRRDHLVNRLPRELGAARGLTRDQPELVVDEAIDYMVTEYSKPITDEVTLERAFWAAASFRVRRVHERRGETVRAGWRRVGLDEIDLPAPDADPMSTIVRDPVRWESVHASWSRSRGPGRGTCRQTGGAACADPPRQLQRMPARLRRAHACVAHRRPPAPDRTAAPRLPHSGRGAAPPRPLGGNRRLGVKVARLRIRYDRHAAGRRRARDRSDRHSQARGDVHRRSRRCRRGHLLHDGAPGPRAAKAGAGRSRPALRHHRRPPAAKRHRRPPCHRRRHRKLRIESQSPPVVGRLDKRRLAVLPSQLAIVR